MYVHIRMLISIAPAGTVNSARTTHYVILVVILATQCLIAIGMFDSTSHKLLLVAQSVNHTMLKLKLQVWAKMNHRTGHTVLNHQREFSRFPPKVRQQDRVSTYVEFGDKRQAKPVPEILGRVHLLLLVAWEFWQK